MKIKMLVFLLLWGGIELSAQTILQQFTAVSSGAGTVSDMDLPNETSKGSVLIAMPVLFSPDIRVLEVTDNAPGGGNTYKQVPGSVSSCSQKSLDIWYCENCKAGVTELKFHLSDHVKGSLNSFVEVSSMALASVLDGSGAQVSNKTGSGTGEQAGPSITTTAKDFVIARYFSDPPFPSGVKPAAWTYGKSYVYALNAPAGPYTPTMTGGKAGGEYCMSVAAFKTGTSPAGAKPGKN